MTSHPLQIMLVLHSLPNHNLSELSKKISEFQAVNHNAKITLLYVIKPLPPFSFRFPALYDLENQMIQTACADVQQFGAALSIPACQQIVAVGSVKQTVKTLTKHLKFDVILDEKPDGLKQALAHFKTWLRKIMRLDSFNNSFSRKSEIHGLKHKLNHPAVKV